jgi:hypothetical protein
MIKNTAIINTKYSDDLLDVDGAEDTSVSFIPLSTTSSIVSRPEG